MKNLAKLKVMSSVVIAIAMLMTAWLVNDSSISQSISFILVSLWLVVFFGLTKQVNKHCRR
ncbi:MAG: hypothetical protein V2I33_03420 [Kangiellaceae bacterium]|nr:hypothetical protein [Kangiellaceae bacterium]